MAKIAYIPDKRFRPASASLIEKSNQIIDAAMAQGFELSLRQLYYQLVSQNIIPNKANSYDNLGALIADARMAGLVDWSAIEDRGRNLQQQPSWEGVEAILESVSHQYQDDFWKNQESRPEVWVEKEALVGVIERACSPLYVPYFACKGYVSSSEMHAAAMRMMAHAEQGQAPLIIHLGDHDPSGIDMTRDITDRMRVFFEHHGYDAPEVRRIALNMPQIRQYNPPPNPAKQTDCRFSGYQEKFGDESWELDALQPQVIVRLVQREIRDLIDPDKWAESEADKANGRRRLYKAARYWPDVLELLNARNDPV